MFWPGVTEVPDLRYRRLFHYAAISTMDGAQPISPAFAQLPRNRALGSGGSSSGWIVGHPEVGPLPFFIEAPAARSHARDPACAVVRPPTSAGSATTRSRAWRTESAPPPRASLPRAARPAPAIPKRGSARVPEAERWWPRRPARDGWRGSRTGKPVRLPPPVLPPLVRERGGQNQHPARDGPCRGPLALHQPYPNGVQRGFQKQNGGGLEGRHVTDGAGHEQVSQSDLKYAEIEEH